MCVCVCVCVCKQICRVGSFLPPCGSQESSSGHEAWHQVFIPTELSHWPQGTHSPMYIGKPECSRLETLYRPLYRNRIARYRKACPIVRISKRGTILKGIKCARTHKILVKQLSETSSQIGNQDEDFCSFSVQYFNSESDEGAS